MDDEKYNDIKHIDGYESILVSLRNPLRGEDIWYFVKRMREAQSAAERERIKKEEIWTYRAKNLSARDKLRFLSALSVDEMMEYQKLLRQLDEIEKDVCAVDLSNPKFSTRPHLTRQEEARFKEMLSSCRTCEDFNRAWNKFLFGSQYLTSREKEQMMTTLSPEDVLSFSERIKKALFILKTYPVFEKDDFASFDKTETERLAWLDVNQAEDEQPLFEGQTGHPLTRAEMQKIKAKLDLSGTPTKYHAQIYEAIEAVAKYPTGREQLRLLLKSPQATFKIVNNPEGDAKGTERGWGGYNNGYETTIMTSSFKNCGPNHLGSLILHEILHEHTSNVADHPSHLMADMHTQAMDGMLSTEFSPNNPDDPAFAESYRINLARWTTIMENNWQGRPDWAPAFKPRPGLRPEKLQEAKCAYVKQMAAMETRTQYMEDFFVSRKSLNEKPSMPVQSYDGFVLSMWYDYSDVGQWIRPLTPSMRAYLKSQYPGLDIEKIDRRSREIIAEHGSGNSSYVSERFKHERIADVSGYTICWNGNYVETFDKIEKSSMSLSGKMYCMVKVIAGHKRRYPEKSGSHYLQRKKMVERLRKMTGFKDGFQPVSYQVSPIEILREMGVEVDSVKEKDVEQAQGSSYNAGQSR